ncbi:MULTISPECIES: serine/threonine-protein kinase [Pseudofrankia]|uniref:serine/threonine-protein kinase n=1 Tax=Pseudofrankia TaxID=2994363 RepID=UPI000234DBC5
MIVDRESVAAALPAIEVGGRLGAGAFGLVLAGRHRRLNRDVAVKVLPAGQEGRSAFEAEAQLLASLDHPHIVRVYDYVETDELCLIVMEQLSGGTLTRRLAGLAPPAACAVGVGVATALAYAHERGVLHRDIKPDNVMFDATSTVKVTDFGIAKIFQGTATTATGQLGTPMYMAPEQIRGGRLGPATDIYALGVLMYRLLVGRPPFDPSLPLQALWHQQLTTTPSVPPSVPAPLADVVLRALAKEPGDRPPSASARDLAVAAVGVHGRDWLAHAGLPLRLDDDVRDAAAGTGAYGSVPPSQESVARNPEVIEPSPRVRRSVGDRAPAAPSRTDNQGYRDEVATRTDSTARAFGPSSRPMYPTAADEPGGAGTAGPPTPVGGVGPRRRRRRLVLVGAIVAVVLLAGALGAWGWTRSQYYIGVHDGRVAIFQGVSVAGLSSVHSTYMSISEVAEPDRSAVEDGIPAADVADARAMVLGLHRVTGGIAALPASPKPSPAPTP